MLNLLTTIRPAKIHLETLRRSRVFIKIEHLSHFFPVFLLLTLSKQMLAGQVYHIIPYYRTSTSLITKA